MVTTLDNPTEINSAEDAVQRVLARLDSGEQLTVGSLKIDGMFCVLGLFADESGLGEWGIARPVRDNRQFGYYRIGTSKGSAQLDRQLVSYYGMLDANGGFDVTKLSPQILTIIYQIKCVNNLASLNDHMLNAGYSKDVINQTLAEVIRSGAIFKET